MKTTSFQKFLMVIGVMTMILGYSIQASAASFTFTERAGFLVDSGTLISNDAGTPFNDIKWYQNTTAGDYQVAPKAGEFNTIAWGRSNDAAGLLASDPWIDPAFPTIYNVYSALRVFGQTGPVDSTFNTSTSFLLDPEGWVVLTKLFHKNSSIAAAYYTLTNTSINGELTITPADYGFPDDKVSSILFLETLNQEGRCPAGSPPGTPCPDYFIDVLSTFAPLYFTSGAGQYEVLFDLAPVSFASIDFPTPNEVRVWTQEGEISQVNVMMKIAQVPEPASLLLLGLGLLGLGFIKRRK